MKKITAWFLALCCALSVNAQFVEFDVETDPQHGDIAVGDINGDGRLDVVFSGRTTGIIKGAIMINNGDGTYTKQDLGNITPGHFACIRFGDIDGDGDLDFIFNGNGGDNNVVNNGIAINDGTGKFTISDKYPIINATISCGFADFNNDGLLDYFMTGNGMENCALFFQQQDGTFVEDKTSFAGMHLVDPEATAIDFNNDGYIDLFINGWDDVNHTRYSSTLKNDGFGNLTTYPQPNIIRKGYGSATWGDVNGDGWLDLLLNGDGGADGENSDNIFRIYKNEEGTMTPMATFADYRQIGVGGGSALIDWDNDGDLDIILGGWSGTKGRQATSLFLCSDPANFSFTESPLSDSFFPGVSENTYEVADLNNDGKIDLLTMGYNGDQATQVGKYNKNICGYNLNTSTAASAKPAAPTGLKQTTEGSGDELMVVLEWTAPGSESTKKGTTYNVALKNKTTGKWLYNPMAVIGGENDGWRKTTGLGNVFTNNRWELYTLPDGVYEWTVQAINGAYKGGSFAAMQTFTIGTPQSVKIEQAFHPEFVVEDGKLEIVNRHELTENATLRVINMNGLAVINQALSQDIATILQKGVYILEIKTEASVYTTKLAVY